MISVVFVGCLDIAKIDEESNENDEIIGDNSETEENEEDETTDSDGDGVCCNEVSEPDYSLLFDGIDDFVSIPNFGNL